MNVLQMATAALRRIVRAARARREREWRHVPRPNGACSRRRLGGDYW
jgi:hypothetical protein